MTQEEQSIAFRPASTKRLHEGKNYWLSAGLIVYLNGPEHTERPIETGALFPTKEEADQNFLYFMSRPENRHFITDPAK